MRTIFLLQGPAKIGKDYLIESLTGEGYGSHIHDNMANGGEFTEKGPLSLYNRVRERLDSNPYLNPECDFIFTMNTPLKNTIQRKLREDGYKIIKLEMGEIVYEPFENFCKECKQGNPECNLEDKRNCGRGYMLEEED